MPEEEPNIRVQVRWPADSLEEPRFINQFVFMPGTPIGPQLADEGTVYMLFGHVSPPLLFTQADVDRAAGELTEVEVDLRASLVLSRARAVELWQLLGTNLGLLSPDGGQSPEEKGGTS